MSPTFAILLLSLLCAQQLVIFAFLTCVRRVSILAELNVSIKTVAVDTHVTEKMNKFKD